ncbi:NADPH:quinone reductase-like Zn-dependent oxidoreductase [Paenibacillus cellulosilyticus]|uniref:NADPH:quinone reductase-like Zn-dependent oxidoreductase n=1 Tax=Paenibacillus cellulosilyticus TaxID=375489 RepID=A0A2V2Z479_9BACL|nr:NAD(P)-dependent alcohol dehydrogenase [Paenibacillus cellulosilyticus]PWW05135.1 NADPH:quinone reductase-like Zn-dependent oxidoreductase [Paenibacillus cellulosilyticus]QKS48680.1 NAD(P)-dependent alcohol dehydrogenase [Paenibacillus cellulosilyticus]
MKAYVLRGGFGLDHVQEEDRPIPSPGPGEVLIRMKAVSLNARDIGVIEGFYEPNRTEPLIPISDGVGEIIARGEHASKFNVGERVSAIFTQSWTTGEPTQENWVSTLGSPLDGLLAEYVVLPEQGLVRVPEHLTDEEASTLPCAAVTAWQALIEEGKIKAGDTAVVQGTGGVSLFALQFAKLYGARVIVTSSSDEKLERAKALGADYGINYRTNPDWEQAVLACTDGRGADHIVDLGGRATLNHSLAALKVGGQISIVGLLSGAVVEGFNVVPAIIRKAKLQAINVGSREMFERMNLVIEQHLLRPVIDRTFPLAQAHNALRYMAQGSAFGKVTIVF